MKNSLKTGTSGLPTCSLFLIAFIYGSVSHGGAFGYLAILPITGKFSPNLIPFILCLNILVAVVALTNYGRRGYFFVAAILAVCRHVDPGCVCRRIHST